MGGWTQRLTPGSSSSLKDAGRESHEAQAQALGGGGACGSATGLWSDANFKRVGAYKWISQVLLLPSYALPAHQKLASARPTTPPPARPNRG